MSDLRLSGADDFLRLSKALKEAGRGELRKDLTKRIRKAVKPLTPETRAEALSRLPKSGGLAAQVAREPQRVQIRTGAKTAGVRLVVGKSKGGARAANDGTIRHPVFGSGRFVSQSVTPGWFDDPANKAQPEIKRAVEDAIESVVDDIVKGAK